MAHNEFDIGSLVAIEFRTAVFYTADRQTRSQLYKTAIDALENTRASKLESSKKTFSSMLAGNPSLTDSQKSLVVAICLHTSEEYEKWWEERKAEERAITKARSAYKQTKAPERAITQTSNDNSLHGGSGYTGKLPRGFAAPAGSESYRSDDEQRLGKTHWVKAVTAAGLGAGHSLGELSGSKQAKSYPAVIPLEELYIMRKDGLLNLMDKATNPANLLRAMLAYYRLPMIMQIGNIGNINSANLNNPENVTTMSQIDAVYQHMKRIDDHKILTPERAMRFLVLCNDVISKTKIKEPRTRDAIVLRTYEEKSRDLMTAATEIKDQLMDASRMSGITENDMRLRIDSDKRRHLADHVDKNQKIPKINEP